MVGRHHRLNVHKFEQTPGDGEGQGSLACCSPWGHKELDMTERLTHFANVHSIQNRSFSMLLPSKTVFIIPEVAHQ